MTAFPGLPSPAMGDAADAFVLQVLEDLGREVLQSCSLAAQPPHPAAEIRFVLLQSRSGILLLELAPDCTPDAVPRLQQRLREAPPTRAFATQLPVIHRALSGDDLWRLTSLLDAAFGSEPPLDLPDEAWMPAVRRELVSPLPPAVPIVSKQGPALPPVREEADLRLPDPAGTEAGALARIQPSAPSLDDVPSASFVPGHIEVGMAPALARPAPETDMRTVGGPEVVRRSHSRMPVLAGALVLLAVGIVTWSFLHLDGQGGAGWIHDAARRTRNGSATAAWNAVEGAAAVATATERLLPAFRDPEAVAPTAEAEGEAPSPAEGSVSPDPPVEAMQPPIASAAVPAPSVVEEATVAWPESAGLPTGPAASMAEAAAESFGTVDPVLPPRLEGGDRVGSNAVFGGDPAIPPASTPEALLPPSPPTDGEQADGERGAGPVEALATIPPAELRPEYSGAAAIPEIADSEGAAAGLAEVPAPAPPEMPDEVREQGSASPALPSDSASAPPDDNSTARLEIPSPAISSGDPAEVAAAPLAVPDSSAMPSGEQTTTRSESETAGVPDQEASGAGVERAGPTGDRGDGMPAGPTGPSTLPTPPPAPLPAPASIATPGPESAPVPAAPPVASSLPASEPAAQVPVPADTPRPVPATPPITPPGLLAALVQRGDAMFAVGDVSAARLLYQRAANAGSGPAATALGKTYDPLFLARIGARGIRPDPAAAADWYRRAVSLRDPEAERLAQQLVEGLYR